MTKPGNKSSDLADDILDGAGGLLDPVVNAEWLIDVDEHAGNEIREIVLKHEG